MERRTASLEPRNLGGLLDETFAIYGRHLKRLIWIAALVQAPATLLSTAILEVWGGHPAAVITTGLVSALAGAVVYAAAIFAVGQHYLTGSVDVRSCYIRAFWRAKSLVLVTLIVTAPVLLVVLTLWAFSDTPVAAYVILLVFPMIAIAVYWSLAIQAVVVEGRKAIGSLGRSFVLIKGSWWRVFGITLVIGLVVSGLVIIINLPYAAVLSLLEADHALLFIPRFLTDLVASTVIPLVIFIAGTLLYYDLRVRKERYDFATLSSEMGIAGV